MESTANNGIIVDIDNIPVPIIIINIFFKFIFFNRLINLSSLS